MQSLEIILSVMALFVVKFKERWMYFGSRFDNHDNQRVKKTGHTMFAVRKQRNSYWFLFLHPAQSRTPPIHSAIHIRLYLLSSFSLRESIPKDTPRSTLYDDSKSNHIDDEY